MNEGIYMLYLRYGFAIYLKSAPRPDENVSNVCACVRV